MDIEKKAKKIINYKEPQIPNRRCNNCIYSYCANAGAYITFLNCKILEREIRKLDKENFHLHLINEMYGICDNYKKDKNN